MAKSYNPCRSGDLLPATATYCLHLKRFIEYMNIPSTNFLQEPEQITKQKTEQIRKICPKCPAVFKIW